MQGAQVQSLVSEVVPAAGCDPKQTKNVKLIESFRDCGSFHNLDHGDSIMDVHISQNVSNCTFKNKNLQAMPLCSGLMASSAKLSDNNQSLFQKSLQEAEEIILKSFKKANIILKQNLDESMRTEKGKLYQDLEQINTLLWVLSGVKGTKRH